MDARTLPWLGFPGARGIGVEEQAAVMRVLGKRALYRGAGLEPPEEAASLERELERATGRTHAVAMCSGTAALVAALRAVGVATGDEVVLPSYGWLTDVSAVLEIGAVPVLAPVREDLNLDPEGLAEAIGPRTKAVVAVGACGLAVDFAPLRAVTKTLPIIDDACQSLGARVGGRGDLEILSFQAFKIVTGGEGGALLTDDAGNYERAVAYHDAGLTRFTKPGFEPTAPRGLPHGIGLNLRLPEIVAALVRVQLARLGTTLERLAVAHAKLAGVFEASGLGLALRAAPAGADNRTYVVLTSPTEELATRVATCLAATGCPITTAAADALHCSTGWLEYLERERFPHRVVAATRTREVLDRVLTMPVNWDLPAPLLEDLRQLLATLDRP